VGKRRFVEMFVKRKVQKQVNGDIPKQCKEEHFFARKP